jgi:hypothetical protein
MKINSNVIGCDIIITNGVHLKNGEHSDMLDVPKYKVSNAEIDNITITDLKGNEKCCAETQKEFTEGEDLMVLIPAKFVNQSIKFDEALYVIRTVALEEFTARIIKNSEAVSE